MTFSDECSTPRRVALVIATIWLAAGARVGSEQEPVCLPVVEYSRKLQARAAEEVEALPEGAALLVMMQDYAVMRAQACGKSGLVKRPRNDE